MKKNLTFGIPLFWIAVAFASFGFSQDKSLERYDGRYCSGKGDSEYLRLIDESFAFLHPNPVVPNISMLYNPEWDSFAEGAGWSGWWIQNSYGFSYAATPILWGINNDLLLHMAFKNRRGMLFGMSKRGFAPMWKLWDEFGMADSKMIGFWEKQPVVTTDQDNVYATAYVKEGKTLVAIGSWVDESVNVKLNIDWNSLGFSASDVTITAPEIKNYQKGRSFSAEDVFPVDAQSDLLLIISKK